MAALLERLREAGPHLPWSTLPAGAGGRLERLADASPLYARVLLQQPALALWLEEAHNLGEEFRFQALRDEWSRLRTERARDGPGDSGHPGALRQFRRRVSLRIAYREINEFALPDLTVRELTRLAEFCLGECLALATARWERRLGAPWDEAAGQPARFCVLGLGKLGGAELNFSSDVDLIYLYEGEGRTRRDGRPTSTTNGEFFHRIGETVTELLQQNDADGFLFRADLRLRPGGQAGPLVPALAAVEYYYAATGQTWERLALLKARPVAGDLALGDELLESLHSFRYPRHPPPALLAEVAAMKQRTEREVVGSAALARDVKSGYGGIREIEFLTQAMQLLHAGRYPFLQTPSTTAALHQLVRYDLLEPGDATALEEAYWLLRRVEHRLQMAEERRTHEVPAGPEDRTHLAQSLGFPDLAEFDAQLTATRAAVRLRYGRLFRDDLPAAVTASDPWWTFFADGRVAPVVAEHLQRWFGAAADEPDTRRELQLFVRGSDQQPLLREPVQRFTALVPVLDRTAPRLARPRATLRRISTFGERYGSRSQFLATCTLNPDFFEVLALLFDRSRFIHDLLSRHPEILDEVLRPEILRTRKDARLRLRELAAPPAAPVEAFTDWLWLYVRAEQVRAAVGQLLGLLDDDAVETELTHLAEAVLLDAVRRQPGLETTLVVALGKLGGGELSFGSDLDLVLLAADTPPESTTAAVVKLRQFLGPRGARDATYALDFRLRPHGESGPLVSTLAQTARYFAETAQPWERQVLTRARVLTGPAELGAAWREFVEETAFAPGLTPETAAALWRMRLRVQNERDVVEPRERAFKTARGGLVDLEFALQILQLRHGAAHPAVRSPNTRDGWRACAAAGLADAATVDRLLANHRHLKRVEWALRRDGNRGVSTIPAAPAEQEALARWLDFPSAEAFWREHAERMQETRRLVRDVLHDLVPSTALETDR